MDEERPYKLDRRYCCICGNKRSDGKLFTVPKNEQLLRKWMELLCREDILELEYLYVRKNARICEAHFHEWAFASTERLKLIKFALPNLENPLFTTEDVQKCKKISNPFVPENPAESNLSEITPVEFAEVLYNVPEHAYAALLQTTSTAPSGSVQKGSATSSVQKGSATKSVKRISATESVKRVSASGSQTKVSSGPKRYDLREYVRFQKSEWRPCQGIQVSFKDVEEKQQAQIERTLKKQEAYIEQLKRRIEECEMGISPELEKNLTAEQYGFIMCLIRQSSKPKFLNATDTELKDISLKMYAQCPSMYKFLKKKLPLPCKSTLRKRKKEVESLKRKEDFEEGNSLEERDFEDLEMLEDNEDGEERENEVVEEG